MPWFTELADTKITDPEGRLLGRIDDLAAARGRYPRVTAVSVDLQNAGREFFGVKGRKAFVPWNVLVRAGRRLVANEATTCEPGEEDLLVKIDILDQQIVDTDGARVVRVNDLLLQESAGGLRITAADVGFSGALRRLRLESIARAITGSLGYRIPEKLIAWNYVAQLGRGEREVRLTVPTSLLRELHPSELADILDQLDIERREQILSVMSAAHLAQTLAESDPEVSRDAVEVLSDQRVQSVIEAMPPDEAADLLGAVGYETAERLLGLMGLKKASILRELLGHAPDSAGGRMTPLFVSIPLGATVGEAIDAIRAQAREAETIYYAYVLDDVGALKGVLSLRQMLRNSPSRPVEEIMERDFVSVGIADDQQEAARLMSRYNLLALPVLDEGGRLRGIVTVDDIVEVLEEEASEDILEVAGVYPGQGSGATSGRLGGYGLSLAAGLLGVVALRQNQAALASVLGVAWLLPLYLRLAQDQGTWSLARALSGHGLSGAARTDVVTHELLSAFASAAFSGILVAAFAGLWTGSSATATSLGAGIFVGTLGAALLGLFLPLAARAAGLHRLLVRGRLLSMLVGMCSLLIYIWAVGSLADRL